MSEKSGNAKPHAYPFIFLRVGQAAETLYAPEVARGNFGISRETVTLWGDGGLLLTLRTRHPDSSNWRRRYAAGYIRELSAFLEIDPPEEHRTSWKKEVREFSQRSAASVRLTKQLYDERLDGITKTDADEPYADVVNVAQLIDLSPQTVENIFATNMGSGLVVLRSVLDACVTWHHEALDPPANDSTTGN